MSTPEEYPKPQSLPSDMPQLGGGDDSAWIEVIQKMDSVYAELVESQVELEHKNEELEDAQQFISSVLASMTDVLIVCDMKGRIQQVNAALVKLTGTQETAFIEQTLEDIFSPQHHYLLDGIAEKLRSAQPSSDVEINILGTNGEQYPLSVNGSPLLDPRGKVVGVVLIGRPLGELQRAYQELDAAHKTLREAQQQLVFSEKMAALGRLVAGVAHELNNPISFVFGNMHALKSYGEKITEYLRAVEQEAHSPHLKNLHKQLRIKRIMDDIVPLVDGTLEGAERVSDIVQELRRFSGNQKEASESFGLKATLETAVSWVLRGAREQPEVFITCAEDVRVRARKGYVHQVVVNLLQNAVDAMDGQKDASITVACGQKSGRIAVIIHDNGSGIADADLPHIFEPFFTTRPIGQGTGLGLYVSYNLAKEMGGMLSCRNHPDGGAEFTFTLALGEEC